MRSILLTVLLAATASINGLYAQNAWVQQADFGGTSRIGAIGFNIGNKGYLGTGENGLGTGDFWEYDPATDTWSQKADFAGGGRVYAVGFSIGNKGYVGTGQADQYKKDFWEYDPALNLWSQKTNFPGHARIYSVGIGLNGKGYVGLGYFYSNLNGTNDYYQDFWQYDPAFDTWTKKANYPNPRVGAVGFSIDNNLYAGSGYNSNDGHISTEWSRYDPLSDTWTPVTSLPDTSGHYGVAFAINGKGYAGTGITFAQQPMKQFWEYDPATDAWTQRADFGGGGRLFAVGFSIGNKGYIGTGAASIVNGGPADYKKDFWQYTPCDTAEICGNGIDDNCNGQVDENCCTPPTWLVTTAITSTSAQLNWNTGGSAIKYKVKYRHDVSGSPWFIQTVAAPNTSLVIAGLVAGKPYKWKVKSVCGGGTSDFSGVEKFTTLLRLANETEQSPAVSVYPNPMGQAATVSFTTAAKTRAVVELFDLKGIRHRMLLNDAVEAGTHEIPIDRAQLASGIYLLQAKLDEQTFVIKVVVE